MFYANLNLSGPQFYHSWVLNGCDTRQSPRFLCVLMVTSLWRIPAFADNGGSHSLSLPTQTHDHQTHSSHQAAAGPFKSLYVVWVSLYNDVKGGGCSWSRGIPPPEGPQAALASTNAGMRTLTVWVGMRSSGWTVGLPWPSLTRWKAISVLWRESAPSLPSLSVSTLGQLHLSAWHILAISS